MTIQIIQQGAEAIIIKSGNKIVKDRIKKGYRLPELDTKLRKLRTRTEARLLEKAFKLINVPKVLKVDESAKKLELEFIEGKKLSENLDNLKNKEKIMEQIGKETAKLHDNNIIHGDLTTSNMIWQEKTSKLFFIDFGLSFSSDRIEDKAVDLHLIKQALEAKHFKHYEKLFAAFLKGYKSSPSYQQVLEQLKKVELRGRYKHE